MYELSAWVIDRVKTIKTDHNTQTPILALTQKPNIPKTFVRFGGKRGNVKNNETWRRMSVQSHHEP